MAAAADAPPDDRRPGRDLPAASCLSEDRQAAPDVAASLRPAGPGQTAPGGPGAGVGQAGHDVDLHHPQGRRGRRRDPPQPGVRGTGPRRSCWSGRTRSPWPPSLPSRRASTSDTGPSCGSGAGTGVRISEALGLTVDRINFLKRQVRIDRQLIRDRGPVPEWGPVKDRHGRARTIPLAQPTLDTLSAHIAQYGTGPRGTGLHRSPGKGRSARPSSPPRSARLPVPSAWRLGRASTSCATPTPASSLPPASR